MIQKAELLAAFNGITDLIVILDPDYTICFANNAFCDFFEIDDPEKVVGMKCHEIIHDVSERCEMCPIHETLDSGNVKTIEKKIRGENLKYWTYPVFDDDKKIKNIVSYARIITEQQKMEQELIQTEKFKWIGRLAAGIAHEINNPLCSILVNAEMILETMLKTDSKYDIVQDIATSVKHAKKITSGFLDYSRQQVYTPVSCGINEIVNKAITLVKFYQKEKRTSIDFTCEKDLPNIKADMLKTIQAFLNIISNGIDASPVEGTITISAQRHGDDAVSVTFRDEGCGITQEIIPQIFDPFFTTKDFGKGTGLGLSIALGIIEQQNGAISVDSEVGKGSSFEVVFPVIEE